jgi:hypothetical protein
VEAARTIYAPAVNPRTRQEIDPALQPGSELAWGGLAGPQPAGVAVDLFKYLVFNDEQWDFARSPSTGCRADRQGRGA